MKNRIDYFSRDLAKLQLRAAANTRYDDAAEMYSCYGAHVTLTNEDGEQTGPDVCVQVVESEWLAAGLRGDDLVDRILNETLVDRRDDAEGLAALAVRVWEDMQAIESQLAEAVRAYEAGDLAACVEALQTAGHAETEHGDDPSTRDLADRLLAPKTTYRVYRAPDGCSPQYCGEYATLEAAQEAAETEPRGLEESLWATARATGHCGGVEDDEPEGWYGPSGWHCVVRVSYES